MECRFSSWDLIILSDINDVEKKLKISLWDSLAIEFDSKKVKIYDHLQLINLNLKKSDATDKNNWDSNIICQRIHR